MTAYDMTANIKSQHKLALDIN